MFCDIIILTVKPFGVVFDSALEGMHLLASAGIVKVSTEYYGVRFGEFRHRATI